MQCMVKTQYFKISLLQKLQMFVNDGSILVKSAKHIYDFRSHQLGNGSASKELCPVRFKVGERPITCYKRLRSKRFALILIPRCKISVTWWSSGGLLVVSGVHFINTRTINKTEGIFLNTFLNQNIHHENKNSILYIAFVDTGSNYCQCPNSGDQCLSAKHKRNLRSDQLANGAASKELYLVEFRLIWIATNAVIRIIFMNRLLLIISNNK